MKRTITILKNKYFLISFGLIIWVCFFDKNDLRTLMKMKSEVRALEEEKGYYAKEIDQINYELKELTTNTDALEKFAREKYLMKRDNEEIFVIVHQ